MHDETTAGQATHDRALAYWTDPNNFQTSVVKKNRVIKRWKMLVVHYINGIDVMLNGRMR